MVVQEIAPASSLTERLHRLVVTVDDGVVYSAPGRFTAAEPRIVYEHGVAPVYVDSEDYPSIADVTGDNAFRHLEELQRIADANGGNRSLGTPGYDASVEYVARILLDAGYTSIGCAPCTRARREGEDVRAGRWWWESPDTKECGLHVVQDADGPRLVRAADGLGGER